MDIPRMTTIRTWMSSKKPPTARSPHTDATSRFPGVNPSARCLSRGADRAVQTASNLFMRLSPMSGPWGNAMFSQAEVQPSRARLVVECKEAPDSAADLRHAECRAAVLGHLEREFGIENVVLSHYVEKQYGPRAMDVLRRTLVLANLLVQA